jgi:uncharacterized cupredoxin-like copper-binding protein
MMQRIGLGVALLAIVVLVACRGSSGAGQPASGGSGGSAQSVTVRSSDTMRFNPATLTVRANTPVTVTLDNSGAALIHDFVIDNPPVKIEAQPNGRANGTMTLPAGTYQFYSSQPGHKEAGMVGTVTAS